MASSDLDRNVSNKRRDLLVFIDPVWQIIFVKLVVQITVGRIQACGLLPLLTRPGMAQFRLLGHVYISPAPFSAAKKCHATREREKERERERERRGGKEDPVPSYRGLSVFSPSPQQGWWAAILLSPPLLLHGRNGSPA
uniref:Uncharacterized protein n=1 Tax=Micrurus spixii TaxID=129469 RepID=A0A2D4MXN8_9SAUR